MWLSYSDIYVFACRSSVCAGTGEGVEGWQVGLCCSHGKGRCKNYYTYICLSKLIKYRENISSVNLLLNFWCCHINPTRFSSSECLYLPPSKSVTYGMKSITNHCIYSWNTLIENLDKPSTHPITTVKKIMCNNFMQNKTKYTLDPRIHYLTKTWNKRLQWKTLEIP